MLRGHFTTKKIFPPVERKRVCIIGAGAAGLVSTKYFSEYHDVDTFEARDDVGGLWYFDPVSELTHPDLKNDEFYKHNGFLVPSIYENMTTNLPKYFMTFKDFSHHPSTPTLMSPKDFHQYLSSYTQNFNLQKHIHLKTLVISVRLVQNLPTSLLSLLSPLQLTKKFLVTTKNTCTKAIKYQTYDHIVCCQGRNSKKFVPEFRGQGEWDGKQWHMHEFRRVDKEIYRGKKVMVVGTGISAYDYIYHLMMSPWKAEVEKVYVVGNNMGIISKSSDFKQLVETGKLVMIKSHIQEFQQGKKVLLKDGDIIEVDIVMYATGYQFSFSFLDKKDNILSVEEEETGRRFISPTYMRMVAIKEPNLNFLGMITGSPFPIAGVDRQVIFSLCILNGWVKLPSKEEMMKEWEEDIHRTTSILKQGIDKVYRFNYRFIRPSSYAEDMRKLINSSGVIHFDEDTSLDVFNPAEKHLIKTYLKGDYLSAKNTDYDNKFKEAVKIFKKNPPSSDKF